MVGITTQGSWTSDEAQNMSIHRIQVFRPITIISAVIGNLILLLLVYHRTSKPVVARGFVLIVMAQHCIRIETQSHIDGHRTCKPYGNPINFGTTRPRVI